ncbi:hypothetical protein KJ570_01450 [Patescibacteria group bacterium]|nr:hypothetical protein [Patescibacteria group bacterium]MBU2036436.1 hypothetical protein [Patescibacteria group bacterium]
MQGFITNNSQYIFPIIYVWSAIWKAIALWKAAKKDAKVWFAIIFVFNSFGLLEILYIFLLYKIDLKKLISNLKSKIKIKK